MAPFVGTGSCCDGTDRTPFAECRDVCGWRRETGCVGRVREARMVHHLRDLRPRRQSPCTRCCPCGRAPTSTQTSSVTPSGFAAGTSRVLGPAWPWAPWGDGCLQEPARDCGRGPSAPGRAGPSRIDLRALPPSLGSAKVVGAHTPVVSLGAVRPQSSMRSRYLTGMVSTAAALPHSSKEAAASS